MIRTVLFDFGGVLTEGGKAGSIARTLAKIYGIDEPRIRLSPAREKLTRGQISDDEFFADLNRLHPGEAKATKENFYRHGDIFVRCEPVYQLARILREHGIRTGILSNVFPMSAAQLRVEGFYEGFDPLVLSCEVKCAKPEQKIFDIAIKKLDLPPHEILFIDDQEKFLAPARQLGMQTIRADSPRQIIADTLALLEAENDLQLELSELQ